MSYNFYKILHLSSLFALALVLGGIWGLYAKDSIDKKLKTFLLALHGLLMFFVFLSGFGLIAKLKIAFPWPFWIYGKLLVWLALGITPFIIRRASRKFRELKGLNLYIILFGLIFVIMFFALWLVYTSK